MSILKSILIVSLLVGVHYSLDIGPFNLWVNTTVCKRTLESTSDFEFIACNDTITRDVDIYRLNKGTGNYELFQ